MPTWLVTGLVLSLCVAEAVVIAVLVYQRAVRSSVKSSGRAATRGEVSRALADQLNQPLTAILSSAQTAERVLAREPLDRGELGELLADVIREDKRAGEVTCRIRAMLEKADVPERG